MDEAHKLVVCVPAKVASTTFKSLLIKNSHQYKHETSRRNISSVHNSDVLLQFGIKQLNMFNESQIDEILRSFTKVVVVRHPLERVFSSFREKLTPYRPNKECSSYMQRLGSKIVKKMRGKQVKCGDDVTFEEFMSYLATEAYVRKDSHWRPIDVVCRPCHIEYDHVLRLETGHSDVRFFVEEILKEKSVASTDEHQNQREVLSEEELEKNDFKKRRVEFANVSASSFATVRKHYENSMRLFGYSSVLTREGMMTSCMYNSTGNTCC